jgi:hypothetical protein
MGPRIKLEVEKYSVRERALRLALLVLLFSAGTGSAQKGAIAFWALPQEKVEAMLLKVPSSDDLRYRQLRQYFSELHCTPKLMEDQKVDKQSAKNLICVLPGQDQEEILVTARYEQKEKIDGVPQGWIEATALPLLYNALQAEERHYTFVFAALAGSAGEKKFFDNFWTNHRRTPEVIIALDRLALGSPQYVVSSSTLRSNPNSWKHARSDALGETADLTIRLQKLPPNDSPSTETMANTLLNRTNAVPTILFYSRMMNAETKLASDASGAESAAPPARATSTAFHQDFDFVAYFLCKLDVVLPVKAQQTETNLIPAPRTHRH